MLSQSTLQDLDLWEVWVEYDQFDPRHFGTLYVIGEITVDHRLSQPYIKKREHGKEGSKRLVLQVPAKPLGRSRSQEVLYSEHIGNINQYTSILVYAGDDLIAKFDDIEVMI